MIDTTNKKRNEAGKEVILEKTHDNRKAIID
jgi:hypothetical protein